MEKQEIFSLLNGAVKMYRSRYNPTSDAVWLAALPYEAPKTVLDVGIGSGGVALCLQHHFPQSHITGLDISDDMLNICRQNIQLNNCDIELLKQDILEWSTTRTFDLVISNPPYFTGTPTTKNPAAHHNTDLTKWIKRCIARVRPHGYFCTIVDAARLTDVTSAIPKTCGDITIIPLFGTKNTAERVLVRCRTCSNGPCTIYKSLPMNCDSILRTGLTIRNFLSNISA